MLGRPQEHPTAKRSRRRLGCHGMMMTTTMMAAAIIVLVLSSTTQPPSSLSAWALVAQVPRNPFQRTLSTQPHTPLLQAPYRGIPRVPTAPLTAVNGGSRAAGGRRRRRRYFWDSSNAQPEPVEPDQPPQTSNENDDDDDDDHKRWLQWMTGGRPRGTSQVILREAAELGGVPRSDRYSSRDWFHSAITLPNSGVLKSIRSPVVAVTSWATFLSLFHRRLLQVNPQAASAMYLPSGPHSLMMSVLGLLLVFRTNSAYSRFSEGRKVWEGIINASRDLYRMVMLYEKQIGFSKRRRLQKLLAAFPYLVRHRIRPNLVGHSLDDGEHPRDPEHTLLLYRDEGPTDDDPELAALATVEEETGKSRRKTRPLFWVDKRTLPWRLLPAGALEKCARAQNRPLWVCDRMAQELREVPDQGTDFTNRERLALICHVDKLSRCLGGAERIHQTSVPLNYARHTLRTLTIWLFSLPFVLLKDLGLWTGPVLFFLSWMLWGIFEIGVKVEDPFQGALRLSILCDAIRRDVLGDDQIRSSAFRLEESIHDKKAAAAAADAKAALEARNASNLGLDSSFE